MAGTKQQNTKSTKSPSRTSKVVDTIKKPKVAAAVGVAAAAAAAAGVAATKLRKGSGTTVLVQANGDDKWELRVKGNKQATKLFDVKEDAVDAARDYAKKNIPSELVIQRADGSEQTRHAYE